MGRDRPGQPRTGIDSILGVGWQGKGTHAQERKCSMHCPFQQNTIAIVFHSDCFLAANAQTAIL